MSMSVSAERVLRALEKHPDLAYQVKKGLKGVYLFGPWKEFKYRWCREEAALPALAEITVKEDESSWYWSAWTGPPNSKRGGTPFKGS